MNGRHDGRSREPAKWLGGVGQASTLGLTFVSTFLLMGFLGYLLDGWLGSYPAFMIVGIFLGAVLGFIKLYYTVFPLSKAPPGPKRKED